MEEFTTWLNGLRNGSIIPYLGPGALFDVQDSENGEAIPADSDSLILAMNGGKPMAPKLMYEFPRAAMNQELKRGRQFVTRFLTQTYTRKTWTRGALHRLLAGIRPPLIIDINRDTQLQDLYADTPHTLISGIARIGGTEFRFKIYHYDGTAYSEVPQEGVDHSLPILFKPMGTPLPEANFVASDADYVDYITELMGGFGLPVFLKEYRKGRQYLLLGMRLSRDSERMVFSDISYEAGAPRGWILGEEFTDKERRFSARNALEIVEGSLNEFLAYACNTDEADSHPASIGC